MEPHLIGQTINNKKIAISLTQIGEETFELIVSVDYEDEYQEIIDANSLEAFKKYRAKQFEYFNKVLDKNE